jgi:phosphopantetheine--protein transferase-like protein
VADPIVSYFARLTGSAVTGETPIRLTSMQIGAAHSWLRRQAAPFAEDVLMRGTFTLGELLVTNGTPASARAGSGTAGDRAALAPVHGVWPARPAGVAVGIDIELVATLPETVDFRADPFYVDHFTDREISHCIGQPDPRESFCGLWAAKEAVLKARHRGAGRAALREIERAVDLAHAAHRPAHTRLFVDTWDLQRFTSCRVCGERRRDRLHAMNLAQRALPPVACAVCAEPA